MVIVVSFIKEILEHQSNNLINKPMNNGTLIISTFLSPITYNIADLN